MEITNEATYNFGKEEYTKKNLTPTDILDLAYAYTQTPITRIVGKKLDDRIKTANDVSRLTGMMQLEPTKKSGKPALIIHLLKNSLVTKDEYIKLFKELVEVHKSIVKYLKNASPERRNAGAAKAAAKDMRGEFGESINEQDVNWNAVQNAIINFLKANTKILDKRVQAKDTEGVKGGLSSIISGLTNAQRSLKLESVNEASMSDIDIIAQEARDFRDFVKEFYKEYKDFPKTKDSLKWLEDIYKGRTKMEGLDKDGMERVASGLPQTQEEN